MISLGFRSMADMLGWIVVALLGAKLVATLVLLGLGKDLRDRPGWGSWLWWTTKVTPVVAVPCLILLAWSQRQMDQVAIFVALMGFVAIAVPWKIRQRRARMARRAPGGVAQG